MSEWLLDARGITMQFGGLKAVNNVDLQIAKGEIHALIGPNGAGKTTLFNVLSGINQATLGTIYFDGQDITHCKAYQVTERGIARTFQNILLFENMNIVENVMVGATTRTDSTLLGSIFRTRKSCQQEQECYEKAMEILDFVGMGAQANGSASSLPYGDKRILEIARALASNPKIMMLDEPAAGMNTTESANLSYLIRRIRDEKDITILLVEHDMKFVSTISDAITVLDHGVKISEGAPAKVLSDPKVIEAYIGKMEDSTSEYTSEGAINNV